MKINKTKFEINKPSELCQVVFFENYKKGVFAYLTPTQIDLLNILFYTIKKEILSNKIQIDNLDPIVEVTVRLTEIHSMLNNKYNKDSESLLHYLYELKKVDVMINSLGKVKDRIEYKLTSIIHTLTWSKHRNILDKNIKVGMDRDVILSFIKRTDYFAKMYLTLQLSMTSKYSKLLYEILKDYEGIKSITIDFQMLLPLLNVNFENTKNGQWALFNQNILKKSVIEINKESDIFVTYDPIKEKLEGKRKQVTKIKFFIKKQSESRLQELGLIEESITDHKLYNKSKTKLDKFIKNGYKVIDETMWIETDIKKNEKQYDSEIRIEQWMKSTQKTERVEIFEYLASSLDNCDDPVVSIDNYKIIGVFSEYAFTRNPQETIDLLNQTIVKMSE